MMKSGFMPEDFMIGILLRLPVKSLLRFESVSKSWLAIITSRNFRYEHLNNNSNNNIAGGCLWAQFGLNGRSENLYFPDETLADLSHHAVDIPKHFHVLHGPCNGIFLVTYEQQEYALWNPATKEYRELPCPDQYTAHYEVESCGFGLDPITKDYKVVILLNIEHETLFLVGKVHTLGTEHWKDFILDYPPPNHLLYKSTCHTYLNGAYYFQFWCCRILCFDMATDAIEAIPPPNELEPIYDSYPAHERFAMFQGTIALFHVSCDDHCLRVWTLKEKSWIKHFHVGLQLELNSIIGCWNNEILFRSSTDRFLLYKIYTQEIRDLGLNETYWGCMGIHAYKESLISIEEEYERRQLRDSKA